MTDLIEKINALRDIPSSNLHLSVRKVAVILTSPRSGSSLVKSILDTHPDIASTAAACLKLLRELGVNIELT